ncbi:hypothetical protein [Nonomuraea cavernae]|uniref:hypothetical protein n=1 Tax=Nonomuraea cavernae TaxID=2045107 RepID=UPI003406099C
MTGVLLSLLVTAWVAIALLAFGYAGLLGQIRQIKDQHVRSVTPQNTFPELAAPSATSRTIALALTTSCGTCETVFEPWLELEKQLVADGHRTALISMDGVDVWSERGAKEVVQAGELTSALLISFQPALLVFDAAGDLISADPVGSADALSILCRQ